MAEVEGRVHDGGLLAVEGVAFASELIDQVLDEGASHHRVDGVVVAAVVPGRQGRLLTRRLLNWSIVALIDKESSTGRNHCGH